MSEIKYEKDTGMENILSVLVFKWKKKITITLINEMHQCRNVYRKKSKNTLKHKFKKKEIKAIINNGKWYKKKICTYKLNYDSRRNWYSIQNYKGHK